MARSLATAWRRLAALGLLLGCGMATANPPAPLFFENFDGLASQLQTSQTYGEPNAFTLDPPPGWIVDNALPPGVPEWDGWSFARHDFWKARGGTRPDFTLGQGVIAVADTDLWNDPLGADPANRSGFFNSLLVTPDISLTPRGSTDDRLTLIFDTSWRGGCCDDGAFLGAERNQNNQTAIIRMRIDGGPPIEVLRWESAPFRDAAGNPTISPVDPQGAANTPNPFFTPDIPNERVYLDLQTILDGSQPPGPASGLARATAQSEVSSSTESASLAVSSSSSVMAGSIMLEFGVEDGGDDGWWAIDSVALASYTTLLGDMNLSGAIDAGDIGAFALGMLDTDEYRFSYYGEFPSTRGSVDSTLDFDDVPWFQGVLEGASIPAPATALARALFGPVPEPGAVAVCVGLLVAAGVTRRRG